MDLCQKHRIIWSFRAFTFFSYLIIYVFNHAFYFFFILEIIDDIVDHAGNTRERLIKETRHVAIVDRKSGECSKYQG